MCEQKLGEFDVVNKSNFQHAYGKPANNFRNDAINYKDFFVTPLSIQYYRFRLYIYVINFM